MIAEYWAIGLFVVAVLRSLADRLVIKDRAADAVAQAGRSDDHFAPGAPSLLGLRNAQGGEPLVAGACAFIHRHRPFPALTSWRAVSMNSDELIWRHSSSSIASDIIVIILRKRIQGCSETPSSSAMCVARQIAPVSACFHVVSVRKQSYR